MDERPTRELRIWQLRPNAHVGPVMEWSLRERGVNRLLVSMMLSEAGSRRRPAKPQALQWALREFEGRILGAWATSTWPGVEYRVPEAGLVLEIDFDARLGDVMKGTGRRLADWSSQHDPPLPEDLCLYRAGDAVPAFYSLTHERQYWVVSERKPALRYWYEEEFDPAAYLVLVGRPRFLSEAARPVDSVELEGFAG